MKIHKYTKSKDYSFSEIYMRWNYTTACCFKYKTQCNECPNQLVCSKFENEDEMHPMKYATMVTFRNIGRKGLDRFNFIVKGVNDVEL